MFLSSVANHSGHSTSYKSYLKLQQHCKYCLEQNRLSFFFFSGSCHEITFHEVIHVYRPTFDVSKILDWDFKDLVLLHALYMFTVVEMNNDLILVFNNIQSVLTSKGKTKHRF